MRIKVVNQSQLATQAEFLGCFFRGPIVQKVKTVSLQLKLNVMKFYSLIALSLVLLSTSCLKGDLSPEEQHADDLKKIQKYVGDNKLNAKSTASGLHYVIQTEGSGGSPTLNNTVSVYYKGYYLDGQVFDESLSKTISFPLKNLILGWQEGLQLFKKGTKGILLVPSALGYGSYPPSGIRRNAVLVFEIELANF